MCQFKGEKNVFKENLQSFTKNKLKKNLTAHKVKSKVTLSIFSIVINCLVPKCYRGLPY